MEKRSIAGVYNKWLKWYALNIFSNWRCQNIIKVKPKLLASMQGYYFEGVADAGPFFDWDVWEDVGLWILFTFIRWPMAVGLHEVLDGP